MGFILALEKIFVASVLALLSYSFPGHSFQVRFKAMEEQFFQLVRASAPASLHPQAEPGHAGLASCNGASNGRVEQRFHHTVFATLVRLLLPRDSRHNPAGFVAVYVLASSMGNQQVFFAAVPRETVEYRFESKGDSCTWAGVSQAQRPLCKACFRRTPAALHIYA